MELTEQFFIEQYRYFLNEGCIFYNRKNYPRDEVLLVQSHEQVTQSDQKLPLIPISNLEDYVAAKKNISPFDTIYYYQKEPYLNKEHAVYKKIKPIKDLNLDFFAHFYQKYPKQRKALCKKYIAYNGTRIEENFNQLLDKVALSKEEVLESIKNFPVTVWKVNAKPLQNLEDYLEKRGFTSDEIDNFRLEYLKKRETQLKEPHIGPNICVYLKEKFHSDKVKLEPYFEFFPMLEKEFIKKDEIDIFDKSDIQASSSDNTLILANSKKMIAEFAIPYWNNTQYTRTLECLADELESYYGFEGIKVKEKRSIVNFEVPAHSSLELSEAQIKKLMIDMISFVKDHPERDSYYLEKVDLKSWLACTLDEQKTSRKTPKI